MLAEQLPLSGGQIGLTLLGVCGAEGLQHKLRTTNLLWDQETIITTKISKQNRTSVATR